MSIKFSSKSKSYFEFSNFYVSPFNINGIEWKTVEHYFQANKFSSDPVLFEKVKNSSSPVIARKLGKTKSNHFRNDWENVKEDIMITALRAKFSQSNYLKKLLIDTNNLNLIEDSFWDSYWGIGKNGTGKNRMGFLLMIIRNELQNS